MRRINFLAVVLLCFLQVTVPTWGAVLCVGENGHVAIEPIKGCTASTSKECIGEYPDTGRSRCCINEGDPRDCSDIFLPSLAVLSRSNFQKSPDAQFEGIILPTDAELYRLPFATAQSDDRIQCSLLVETVIQRNISTVVLQI